MSQNINWKNAEESETKKCSWKAEACKNPAVGVISAGLGHAYVCREHAQEAESQGYSVDYDNWRL
jgi:hypothetical protein